MNKKVDIMYRDRQMLELLAQGVSNRAIAESLGYREGTMRVYLHGLYRKLGVSNKTSAVIWYFDRLKGEGNQVDGARATVEPALAEESFGDVALRTNPFAALGVMSLFVGAYSRVWEVANRLKGASPNAKIDARRRQSRRLWEALLQGDFAYGKRFHDGDGVPRLMVDSPSDCVLVACLLLIGGYTGAADRVVAELARRAKGRLGVSASEQTLLRVLRDAMERKSGNALAGLYQLAVQKSAKPHLRQTAMVALYWAYRAGKDPDRARGTADAIWAEAEAACRQLQAMGERVLPREVVVPQPASMDAKGPGASVEKVAGSRALLREH